MTKESSRTEFLRWWRRMFPIAITEESLKELEEGEENETK